MYSPIRRNTRKQGNTSAFDRKFSLSGARKQLIIKEEGCKEEDRQEADVKNLFVKNGYADLKRRHQNDENQEDF